MKPQPNGKPAASKARKKIKVQTGLKILVTPDLVVYWQKRPEYNGSSPFPPSAILMVFDQRQDKDWNVGAVAAGVMVALPEHWVRASAVAHQVMQLGYTAEKFFRAVAEKAGGIYQGMQRLQGQGWVGHLLMTGDKEQPDKPYLVPETNTIIYPWIYTSLLPDAAMQDELDVVPEALIETYVQGLVMNYVNDKWHPQPVQYTQ